MLIQAKLNIGEPNDKYEREADDNAAKVVQQINSSPQNYSVQRQGAMEKKLQRKPLVQRQNNLGGGEASSALESSIQSARGHGQTLDTYLQAKMGQAMGANFSNVRVHTDSQSDRLNKSIQAKAFTTGQDIFFQQGAYEPRSRGGQELIAHELTHVVQQNERPTDLNLRRYSTSTPPTQIGQASEVSANIGTVTNDGLEYKPENPSWLASHPPKDTLGNEEDRPIKFGVHRPLKPEIPDDNSETDGSESEHENSPKTENLNTSTKEKHKIHKHFELLSIDPSYILDLHHPMSDIEKWGNVGDDQLNGLAGLIVSGYKIYREQIDELLIKGGEKIDQIFLENDTLEEYISSKILPQLDTIEVACQFYAARVQELNKESLIEKGLRKLKFNSRQELREGRQEAIKSINSNFINDEYSSISQEKEKLKKLIQSISKQNRNDYKNKIEKKKKLITKGVKTFDPKIAKEIEKSNQGIKAGGKIELVGGGLSKTYLVPNGFFKPLSQSPHTDWALPDGHQVIREILAYEFSKYIGDLFEKELGIKKDLGIVKTGLAVLSSEEFAHAGINWNKNKKKNVALAKIEAEMPEQIGVWQEQVDIKYTYNKLLEEGGEKLRTEQEVDTPERQDEVQKIAFFDLMTGNYDRHGGNLVFDKQGKLRPVDQGEMLPTLDRYEVNQKNGNNLAWSQQKAAKAPFSEEFQILAEQLNPDQVITHLKGKVEEISRFAPELTEKMIPDESWELMKLHLIATKQGIKAGLSPKELQEIFISGEVHAAFRDLKETGDLREKTGSANDQKYQPEDFQEAEAKVLKAINNGKEKLLRKKYGFMALS
ncbi:eCIS core domain-containing protein [Pseudanabaena sp. Chao 1811]|uniref:eCIS core domain-containing protein n=1 Tax=Pseudanabaena sp. Chao 1811 TaxID=2963092 RepID=UPI0022F37E5F|nr:DUF4157 domain-containing protein [Pseudanabaena sp. Chao 1811]